MRTPRLLLTVPLLLALPAVAACGSDADEVSSASVAASSSASSGTEQAPATVVLIDVRTPEEYAAGHLDGARNLDVEDGTLQAALADLDPTADYAVYCRSGRRSAIAVEAMRAAGFTSVSDLGGIDAAQAETGLDVVTG